MSNLTAGLAAIVVVAVGTWFGFTKRNPFAHHYEVRAVLADANSLAPRSPVRIAGVEVGRVARVGRYRQTPLSVVTMRITDAGRPLHRDATLKVRPRLFLEGNFYVDLTPGTPGAPELPDGGTIPLAQTSAPVQLDNVLTALDQGVRGSLQHVVEGLGGALDTRPTAGQDAELDPGVRGATGGEALNRAVRTSPAALRGTAVVAEALRGPRPGDLSRTIRGFARAAAALDADDRALASLIVDFRTLVGVTAARSDDLRETARRLPGAALTARRALQAVDLAVPPTRRLARSLSTAMTQLPATIDVARPWLRQTGALLRRNELGGLLRDLQPVAGSTAQLVATSTRLTRRSTALSRCFSDVLLPTGDVVVSDGPLTTGSANYKELFHGMVGQASEAQVFDGNGSLLRLQAIGGDNPVTSGVTNYVAPSDGPLFSNTTLRPARTSPAYPNRVPPVRTDVACHTQPVPDVNGPSSVGPADGSRAGARQPAAPPKLGEG